MVGFHVRGGYTPRYQYLFTKLIYFKCVHENASLSLPRWGILAIIFYLPHPNLGEGKRWGGFHVRGVYSQY